MNDTTRRYTSNPTSLSGAWIVWDVSAGLSESGSPRRIVFTGTMEECGLVADAMSARRL